MTNHQAITKNTMEKRSDCGTPPVPTDSGGI